jgi:hypothetical protein
MKIGVLVAQTSDGKYQYIGEPGNIPDLDALMCEIVKRDGTIDTRKKGIKANTAVKLWLSDVTMKPIARRQII